MTDIPLRTGGLSRGTRRKSVEKTTTYKRVRAIMKRTDEPQSVTEIGEKAGITQSTARTHLRHLARVGIVERAPEGGSTTHYDRSDESLVLERTQEILEDVEKDDLLHRIEKSRERIRSYRNTVGTETPEDAALRGEDVDQEKIRNWQTTRRNIHLSRAALAFKEAKETVRETPPEVRATTERTDG